jgi:pimeloyl-ACP methyl ester carboxylesterase
VSRQKLLNDWFHLSQPLEVDGANSRIWRQGKGDAVVCLHGVPASAFLYRKVLPALANNGLEGVAFDFPGLGFSERPVDFDYSWSALAAWAEKAVVAANIEKFHLVVHDIGGPIGFELIRRIPDKILSLTVLNTLVHVESFNRPWVMEPFTYPLIDRLWVASLRTPAIIALMRMQGMHDGPTNDEIRAYGDLLTMNDGGRAFRKIMRGFERTAVYEEGILAALRDRAFPAQVIWGEQDPALKMNKYVPDICQALSLNSWHKVRGKHFLQEDSPIEIAQHISDLVNISSSS